MGLRNTTSHRGALLLTGVLGFLLALATIAYACAPQATLDIEGGSANPPQGDGTAGGFAAGQEVDGAGHGFTPGAPVEIRFDQLDGPVLWSGTAGTEGTFSFSFEVPDVEPGHYVILGDQKTWSGDPARVVLEVTGDTTTSEDPRPTEGDEATEGATTRTTSGGEATDGSQDTGDSSQDSAATSGETAATQTTTTAPADGQEPASESQGADDGAASQAGPEEAEAPARDTSDAGAETQQAEAPVSASPAHLSSPARAHLSHVPSPGAEGEPQEQVALDTRAAQDDLWSGFDADTSTLAPQVGQRPDRASQTLSTAVLLLGAGLLMLLVSFGVAQARRRRRAVGASPGPL